MSREELQAFLVRHTENLIEELTFEKILLI